MKSLCIVGFGACGLLLAACDYCGGCGHYSYSGSPGYYGYAYSASPGYYGYAYSPYRYRRYSYAEPYRYRRYYNYNYNEPIGERTTTYREYRFNPSDWSTGDSRARSREFLGMP